jgi:regulator of sirC expression with transglutaminase-like and TPR domain
MHAAHLPNIGSVPLFGSRLLSPNFHNPHRAAATNAGHLGVFTFSQASMTTTEVLSKLGAGLTGYVTVNTRDHGPWFRMIAAETMLSDEQLRNRDIGHLNLEAAIGLPGAEDLNLDACVQTLNAWAERVQEYTESRWHLFLRSPEKYENSPAYFRMLLLVTVLQKQLGVTYNLPFMKGDSDATDSRNLFLHGILMGHGGTCATMPVLYIAIGRRLGYPLKLVETKQHLFVRWEEPGGQRFNIEATSAGLVARDDDHYRSWPEPITETEIQKGYFLRSLRPREEMAVFLDERARCLRDNLRLAEAIESHFLAAKLAPKHPNIRGGWAVSTILARALEQSRQAAGIEDYSDLDLRKVRFPKPSADGPAWERWAIGQARENLQRIARIHENARAAARDQVFGALDEADSRRLVDRAL